MDKKLNIHFVFEDWVFIVYKNYKIGKSTYESILTKLKSYKNLQKLPKKYFSWHANDSSNVSRHEFRLLKFIKKIVQILIIEYIVE